MTTEPIRSKDEIEAIKAWFLDGKSFRNFTMFVLGINTALRISDLLTLKWEDVFKDSYGGFKNHIFVTEHKTKKTAVIALNENAKNALLVLKSKSSNFCMNNYIFESSRKKGRPITRIRAYQIMRQAVMETKLEGTISCHSLRKTFGYHAWKKGVPPAVIMSIYNHSSIEITKKYLCINQDDKDSVYNYLNL